MKVKIKKLVEDAVIPFYAKDGDAGMDLTCVNVEYDPYTECEIYHTGIAVEIPKGYVGLVFPRSSNRKTDSYMTNSVGVIDSGYRGEILVCFKNRDCCECLIDVMLSRDNAYKKGDRVAQLIIMPYPQIEFEKVEELSDSERGTGGHGSTGK